MVNPAPFDARNGLPPNVLKDLQRAHRVVVGLKDRATGVLGYWVKVDDPDHPADEALRLVILAAEVHTNGRDVTEAQPLTVEGAQDDLLWHRAISELRAGDRAIVEWQVGWGAVSLRAIRGPERPQGTWTPRNYRTWSTPLVVGSAPPCASALVHRELHYYLGNTATKRRWKVGRPTWVWGSPA